MTRKKQPPKVNRLPGTISPEDALRYIQTVADLFGLKEWKLHLSPEAPDDDAWADVDCHAHEMSARIRLGSKFYNGTPEEQRDTVVHELFHVHTWLMWEAVSGTEEDIGKSAFAQVAKRYRDAEERMVWRLSGVVSKQLPLPNKVIDAKVSRKVKG